MITLIIYRHDFRDSQDYPHESLFEGVLRALRIPDDKWDKIEEITITDIMTDSIETG